jgi:hypothetical protein
VKFFSPAAMETGSGFANRSLERDQPAGFSSHS